MQEQIVEAEKPTAWDQGPQILGSLGLLWYTGFLRADAGQNEYIYMDRNPRHHPLRHMPAPFAAGEVVEHLSACQQTDE